MARTLGVSESSVKRWADEGRIAYARTAGGHRRILIGEACRFIRASGLAVVDPSALGLEELRAVQGGQQTAEQRREAIYRGLLDGDAAAVTGLVIASYLAGHSVADICDGPLCGAMHTIGDLWHHTERGIFIEHRASEVCTCALQQLRTLMPPRADHAPVALGGALAGDHASIGTLMAATVLAAEGFREINLGAQTPPVVLATAAREMKPALLWASASLHLKPEKATGQIRELLNALDTLTPHIIVGGSGMGEAPDERVTRGRTMADLSAFARRIVSDN